PPLPRPPRGARRDRLAELRGGGSAGRAADGVAAGLSGGTTGARSSPYPRRVTADRSPTAGARPVRAPRGPELSCRGWGQEAALRMLMNNLDPGVAENPDALVAPRGAARA